MNAIHPSVIKQSALLNLALLKDKLNNPDPRDKFGAYEVK